MKVLTKRDGVHISKDTDSDLKEILKQNLKYPANTFHRILQSQAASTKDVRRVCWHPAMIRSVV